MSFEIFYVKPWESADSGRAIVWKPFLWLPKRTGENYSLDIERIEGQILLLYTLKIFMTPLSVPIMQWNYHELSLITMQLANYTNIKMV